MIKIEFKLNFLKLKNLKIDYIGNLLYNVLNEFKNMFKIYIERLFIRIAV